MENRDRDKDDSESLDEPNRRRGNVDDSGMQGIEKESPDSSSNLGDNVSDRKKELEH